MKTAVSLPDDLFEAADALAAELGVSRSGLYRLALERFVDAEASDRVTAALNELYSSEDSSIDQAWLTAGVQALKAAEATPPYQPGSKQGA